jgi:cobalt-zinc-cadmium efflux system protein
MKVANQYSWNLLEAFAIPCFCGIQHAGDRDRQLQAVKTSLILVSVFCVTQWLIGHWSSSLALQADAGHLLSDALALVITFSAIWLAKRPAHERATFGHQRVEILAALLNGLGLLGISVWIIHESWLRWQAPQAILSTPMILGSLIGLCLNVLNLLALYKESQQSLNLRAAFLHTVSDLASSIGAIIAGISIHFWHCFWVDTFIGLIVAALTIATALPLLKDSLEVFLEYAPLAIDIQALQEAVLAFPEVKHISTLRLWSLTQENTALCLKIQVSIELDPVDRDYLLKQIETQLKRSFGVSEVTIQISSLPSQAARPVHQLFQQSLAEKILLH